MFLLHLLAVVRQRERLAASKHPMAVARLPRLPGSAADGRNADSGRFRQGVGQGPGSMEGQDGCTATVTEPRRPATFSGGKPLTNPVAENKRRTETGERKTSSLSNDVITTSSNSPQAPKPPSPRPSTVRSLSSRCDMSAYRLSTPTSKDKRLRHRLCELRLSRDDVSRNKDIINKLNTNILNELMENSHHQLRNWAIMNSGSYYDKTKVR